MKTNLHSLFITLALFTGVHPALGQLTNFGVAHASNQTVLFWPTTVTNCVLQSTTNLASHNWVTVSNAVPVAAVTVTSTSRPEHKARKCQALDAADPAAAATELVTALRGAGAL